MPCSVIMKQKLIISALCQVQFLLTLVQFIFFKNVFTQCLLLWVDTHRNCLHECISQITWARTYTHVVFARPNLKQLTGPAKIKSSSGSSILSFMLERPGPSFFHSPSGGGSLPQSTPGNSTGVVGQMLLSGRAKSCCVTGDCTQQQLLNKIEIDVSCC